MKNSLEEIEKLKKKELYQMQNFLIKELNITLMRKEKGD